MTITCWMRRIARGALSAAGGGATQSSAGPARPDGTRAPVSRSRDDVVRDLVARGIVPAATLDDGSQITSRALAGASRSRDDVVRDLVARGIVPAATLDDGSQIVGPALRRR